MESENLPIGAYVLGHALISSAGYRSPSASGSAFDAQYEPLNDVVLRVTLAEARAARGSQLASNAAARPAFIPNAELLSIQQG
jgi:hypothetical protein